MVAVGGLVECTRWGDVNSIDDVVDVTAITGEIEVDIADCDWKRVRKQTKEIKNKNQFERNGFWVQSMGLTGMPAVHGDDAVAALDNELVDPYRTRPDAVKDGSLIVSERTVSTTGYN